MPVRQRIGLNRVGKAMAKGMKASVDTLALSQLCRELDLTPLQALRREQFSSGSSPKITLNTLMMAAVARVLPNNPLLNAELVENEIVVYEPVNLGMAVATSLGLVVTVVPNADKLSLVEIAEKTGVLAERARSGKIQLSDIEGGTFTFSNLGMFGIDGGFALPRPPESAILLLGAVRPRPAIVAGRLENRETCWASLTYDHRFIDGACVANFFNDLAGLVSDPQKLLSPAG